MSQVTIYHDADVTVTVVPGSPPVDQSALIAQLQAENAAFRAFRDRVMARAQARVAADAASVDGQADLDDAATLPA